MSHRFFAARLAEAIRYNTAHHQSTDYTVYVKWCLRIVPPHDESEVMHAVSTNEQF